MTQNLQTIRKTDKYQNMLLNRDIFASCGIYIRFVMNYENDLILCMHYV